MADEFNEPARNFGYKPELLQKHLDETPERMKMSLDTVANYFKDTPLRTTVHHNVVKKYRGDFLPPQNQPRGTCTSRGLKMIGDVGQYVAMAAGEQVDFKELNHAIIYGLGREIAGMLGGNPNNERDDGCSGVAVARGAVNTGSLTYDDTSEANDNRNNDDLACLFGAQGVPQKYKDAAGAHKFKGMAAIDSVQTARLAIVNGYGFTVASNVGFEGLKASNGAFLRDSDGLAHRGNQWPHQMGVSGWREDRDWFLVNQSWGPKNPDGPLGSIDIPSYCFWITAQDMAVMISQRDSWVLDMVNGWRPELLRLYF